MIPDHLILIKSDLIQSVEIKENDEKLVDLATHVKSRNSGVKVQGDVKVREGVADKLINAENALSEGYHLLVVEGYRSPLEQEALWTEHRAKLKERHPDWDDTKLDDEASILYSPPGTVMPHATGGAVDVTVVDAIGDQINMGTKIQDDAEKTVNRTYTLAEDIAEDHKKNRQMLIDAMGAGNFTNYATEWWHWSAGDQYWAHSNEQPFALYGVVED